jgi:teichuronic acid biosynthesis glycosyltransferase TuaC
VEKDPSHDPSSQSAERYGPRVLRVLVVSNMLPDAAHPERGRFVRDQVAALRRLPGLEVELYEFPPGPTALFSAARKLRGHRWEGRLPAGLDDGPEIRPTRSPPSPSPPTPSPRTTPHGKQRGPVPARVDVVHAHFGLTAWPALAVRARVRGLTVHGTDVRHPRTRVATRAVLPLMDLLAAPTAELAHELPGRTARARAQVLPCGVDMERFRPLPRAAARAQLGLDAESPCLLFPADPARAGKRYDRALALAHALAGGQTGPPTTARPPGGGGVPVHTLGGVPPEEVPLWVNAANAVVVPSEAEGFGLAVLEALACDVPVLATPVGVHPQALEGVKGALCAPFEVDRWRAAAEPHLHDPEPRIAGRSHAEPFSAAHMAERLASAWRAVLGEND